MKYSKVQKQKQQTNKAWHAYFQTFSKTNDCHIYKVIFPKKCSRVCLLIFLGVLVFAKINNVGLGGLDTSKNPEIMAFWVLSLKTMKSGFYDTNLKQINSRKLSKVLFKHMSTINCPKMTIIIPICFPMIFPMLFLWNADTRLFGSILTK